MKKGKLWLVLGMGIIGSIVLFSNAVIAANSLDAADGDPLDAVYVDNAGNVGIGITDPGAKLAVVGNVTIAGGMTHDDAAASAWIFRNEDLDKNIEFYVNDGGIDTLAGVFKGTSGNLIIGSNTVETLGSRGVEVVNTGGGAQFFANRTDGALMEFSASTNAGIIGTRNSKELRLRVNIGSELILNGSNADFCGNSLDNLDDITHDGTGSSNWIFKNEDQDRDIIFKINNGGVNTELMRLDGSTSRIGIGTASPTCKLDVNGHILAKEINVDINPADFVFEDNYELRSLETVEKYITVNKHLPDIPSGEKIEAEGIGLGKMQSKLLQKIEELTLYAIEQEKRIEELEKIISRQ